MTAEAVSVVTDDKPSLPDWVFPPPEGFVAEDLDRIPDLPAHTELIDGSLVFVSPQRQFHSLAISLLELGLRRTAPGFLRVLREMSVITGRQQRPEPDISVVERDATLKPEQTSYEADQVILVVEVVSPDSVTRDTERKPVLYAKAGIPYFWRVEMNEGRPVVYTYELDAPSRRYVPVGIFHDRLKVSRPFEIDIDLTEIDNL